MLNKGTAYYCVATLDFSVDCIFIVELNEELFSTYTDAPIS